MTAAVIFFITLMMPGHEPIHFEYKMDNLESCLFEEHEILVRPPHELLIAGGQIQAGCARDYPPSIEH